MKYDRLTYTHFYNVSKSCDDRDCINKNYEEFVKRISVLAINHSNFVLPEYYSMRDGYFYSATNFLGKWISGGFNVTRKKSGGEDEFNFLTFRDVDTLDDFENKSVWGNETFKDYQDKFNILGVSYQEETKILVEASKGIPDIVIYRGIDRKGLIKNKTCYGGFFINNGSKIPVPELGCMTI